MDAPKTRLAEAIRENAELLANLEKDLSTCPAWKLSHQWGQDRVRAREGLLRRRELLHRVVESN
jgi:hypothetical protein